MICNSTISLIGESHFESRACENKTSAENKCIIRTSNYTLRSQTNCTIHSWALLLTITKLHFDSQTTLTGGFESSSGQLKRAKSDCSSYNNMDKVSYLACWDFLISFVLWPYVLRKCVVPTCGSTTWKPLILSLLQNLSPGVRHINQRFQLVLPKALKGNTIISNVNPPYHSGKQNGRCVPASLDWSDCCFDIFYLLCQNLKLLNRETYACKCMQG
jgi:hypothetical protein